MKTDTPETDESTLKATNIEDIKAYKQFLKETNAELKRERDEWKAKYIQQNKDLGCELRDPNGTIWDHAKTLQRERDKAREALRDMLSGWRYIRQVHGDLYGVGWDRSQIKAEKALEGAK
jgi:hypothetical protein